MKIASVLHLHHHHHIQSDFAPGMSACLADEQTSVRSPRKDAIDTCALSFILSATSPSNLELQVSLASLLHANTKRSKSSTSFVIHEHSRSDELQVSLQDAVGATKPVKPSKLCIVKGCTSRSKVNKRCWRHGGSTKRKAPSCNNRAKSRGVCWSRGGGSVCSFENYHTISVSRGLCWAHGGGKRCVLVGCFTPACKRTQNYCSLHFEELWHAAP